MMPITEEVHAFLTANAAAQIQRDVFVCSAQDAPYPPEKAKFVLRKSERSAAPKKSET